MSKPKGSALDIGLLVLRVAFGLGIAHHGYAKVFGGQIPMLTEGVGKMGFPFPVVFAWAAALSEFAGGIFLALGLLTRFAAFFVFFTMAVAFFVAHAQDPLQVKELAGAYGSVALALMLTGAGAFSVDGMRK